MYASTATHNSVDKAIQLLGLGRDQLRKVRTHADGRVDVDALADAIDRDLERGARPLAVIANAGSVDTAAIDDMDAIADLCACHGVWMHVDGAFGAIAALSPELSPRLRGMERADSLAFDFHKWLHVPYGAGGVLFRDEASHRAAFTVPAPYLSGLDRGPGAQPDPSHQFGPELSRGAVSINIWMTLRRHGLPRFGELAAQNVDQAERLAAMIDAAPDLELLRPVSLNIVCYRFTPTDGATRSDEELDAINAELLMRLQERGIAVPSHTVLEGRFAIRVCITNHRTRHADLELLIADTQRIGAEIVAERVAAPCES